MLQENRRQQLDGIVQKMIINKESDANIQMVVNDFSQKYAGEKPATAAPVQPIEKPTGILEKAKSGAFNLGSGVLKGAGSTAASLGQLTLKAGKVISPFESVDKFLQGGIEEGKIQKETTLKPEGTAQKVGFGAEQVAEMFTPTGLAGIASKIPQVASKAPFIAKLAGKAAKTVATSLESGIEFGGKTLLQTGDTEKAKSAATISALVPPAASLFKTVGRGIAEKIIPLSSKEAQIVQAYRAKVPFWERVLIGSEKSPTTAGRTAFNTGLVGTESMIGVGAKKGANNLWDNVISPKLKKSTVKIEMKSFWGEAKDNIIKKNPELSRQQDLLEALSSLKEIYKGVKIITPSQLQKFKEGWAKFVPEKAYKGKPIAGAFNDVKDIVSDIARKKLYSSLGAEAKQAYFDYGNLVGLQALGQKAMTGGKLKGGAGSFISALADMALTPVGTIGGHAIYKTGQGIEFIGRQGAKTLTDIFN